MKEHNNDKSHTNIDQGYRDFLKQHSNAIAAGTTTIFMTFFGMWPQVQISKNTKFKLTSNQRMVFIQNVPVNFFKSTLNRAFFEFFVEQLKTVWPCDQNKVLIDTLATILATLALHPINYVLNQSIVNGQSLAVVLRNVQGSQILNGAKETLVRNWLFNITQQSLIRSGVDTDTATIIANVASLPFNVTRQLEMSNVGIKDTVERLIREPQNQQCRIIGILLSLAIAISGGKVWGGVNSILENPGNEK